MPQGHKLRMLATLAAATYGALPEFRVEGDNRTGNRDLSRMKKSNGQRKRRKSKRRKGR